MLAGRPVGESIRGVQSQHVISTMKHFALNDMETSRNFHSAEIGEQAMRESDLLAFEIALDEGKPGSVMCSYNRINGTYGCEHDYLMNRVLKQEWKFPGFVMSDWGGVHSGSRRRWPGWTSSRRARCSTRRCTSMNRCGWPWPVAPCRRRA